MSVPDDALKTIAAVAAAATAVVGVLPAAADARRRRTSLAPSPKDIHVVRMVAPRPWSDGLNLYFIDATSRTRRRRRLLTVALLVASWLLAVALTYLYGTVSKSHELSAWWRGLGVGAGAVLIVTLTYYLAVMVRHPRRGTLAGACSGYVLVTGKPAEVLQHCQAVLLAMGARLVSVRRNEIVAATGTVLGPVWLGNRVVVTTGVTPRGQVMIRVSSTKLDFVTTSRSKKDVVQFVSSWALRSEEATEDDG